MLPRHKSRFTAVLVPSPGPSELPEVLGFLQHYLMGIEFHFYAPGAPESEDLNINLQEDSDADSGPPELTPRASSVSEKHARENISAYDYVLLTKPRAKLEGSWVEAIRDLAPSRVVDVAWRESVGVESRLTTLAGNLRGLETTKGTVERLSAEIRRLRESTDQSILVGTGPSSRKALEVDMTDCSAIVCNTVILDNELMQHLRPDFLTFSDPAYHLGPSPYARAFREKVREAAQVFPQLNILTLRKHHKPLEMMLPELTGRILSVDQGATKSSTLNLDIDVAPIVRPYPNILTLLMLPLAASFASHIRLFGFDGRSNTDSKFWTHGSSVQFGALLENHQDFHSGFHSIKYEDYFAEHCDQVDQVITAVEEKGITVEAASQSNVPALSTRFRVDSSSTSEHKAQALLSVSAGWQSGFGHYEAWNKALHASTNLLDVHFKTFAHRELGESALDWVAPCLSMQSVVGEEVTFSESASAAELTVFIVQELQQIQGPATVFLYEGLPRDVAVWTKVAQSFPSTKFVLNIMRSDTGSLQTRQRHPDNLTITCDNEWSIDLLSKHIPNTRRLPFFSPVSAGGATSPQPNRLRPLRRLLWPANPLKAKGHHELEATVNDLAPLLADGDLEFVWRIPPQRDSGASLDAQQRTLEGLGVQVIQSAKNMNPGEFRDFIASFDLVVLPYSGIQRTSGLAVDSLNAGTAVMTFEGNWISELGLSGEAIVSIPESPGALGRAIRSLIEHNSLLGVSDKEHAELGERFAVSRLIRFLTSSHRAPLPVGRTAGRAVAELDFVRRKHVEATETQAQRQTTLLPYADSAFSYAAEAHMDEAKFVKSLLTSSESAEKKLSIVDVGAANGSFFSIFNELISEVWAIEPHPDRAQKLRSKFHNDPRINVVQAAVSNTHGGTVTLWDSDESWGVSTLEPWLTSHTAAHEVAVLRLADMTLPPSIDILKVDAEGHDLSVIQSLDWSKKDVGVIICEYDDQKLPDGGSGSWVPLIDFLEDKGFSVLISEWYPIEKYGGNHKWRQMHIETSPHAGSWGNIIGFKNQLPGEGRILSSVLTSVRVKNESSGAFISKSMVASASAGKLRTPITLFTIESFLKARLPRMHSWLVQSAPLRKKVQSIKSKFHGK